MADRLNLLFDLDGTLTDPLVGISRCIQHAMSQLGREAPPTSEISRFIGPPLSGTFAELLGTTDAGAVSQALAFYRDRYATVGMFENEIYPDVRAALEQLCADGHRLFVVTSKPSIYARGIVAHFGLSSCFRETYGSELDGRNADKADLIRIVLGNEGLAPGETWMIGDRSHDVRGGKSNGARTAGVLWGYGSLQELRAEEPDVIVASMPELVEHVHGLVHSPPSGPIVGPNLRGLRRA